jgi:hypothetical protein
MPHTHPPPKDVSDLRALNIFVNWLELSEWRAAWSGREDSHQFSNFPTVTVGWQVEISLQRKWLAEAFAWESRENCYPFPPLLSIFLTLSKLSSRRLRVPWLKKKSCSTCHLVVSFPCCNKHLTQINLKEEGSLAYGFKGLTPCLFGSTAYGLVEGSPSYWEGVVEQSSWEEVQDGRRKTVKFQMAAC